MKVNILGTDFNVHQEVVAYLNETIDELAACRQAIRDVLAWRDLAGDGISNPVRARLVALLGEPPAPPRCRVCGTRQHHVDAAGNIIHHDTEQPAA